jgi:NADH:ubiquinone oxidoreductase subunit C
MQKNLLKLKTVEAHYISYYLINIFEPFIVNVVMRSNETQIFLTIRKSFFYLFILILKKHSLFCYDSLMDIWGVDLPFKSNRFCINYLLNSLQYNSKLIIKVYFKDLELQKSLSNLYNSAGWLERECFDMFGIQFQNNLDLRRILTDYGFDGFPLRKDFPLSGFYELKYDFELKHIKFEPVELTQEFRLFYFQKVWK